jgi:hypothetical protein
MTEHDRPGLGGYAMGILDPGEARAVDEHLAGCASCRAELAMLTAARDVLGEVPPEAFLDGPPEGGDLLLQRTLRAVRASRPEPVPMAPARSRRLIAIAAGVAILAIVAAAGGLIGRQTAPATASGRQPGGTVQTTVPGSPTSSGVRLLTATDPDTGASMSVVVTPAAGWIRLHAKVDGVPAGTQCQLVVHGRGDVSVLAGSWMVSPTGEKQGTMLDGTALVAAGDITAVTVQTVGGKQLVTASG